MKYKLLTFCEDYADEHNVPALACMTEEEYNIWLKKPSGKLNPDYEKQNEEFQKKLQEYKEFIENSKKRKLFDKLPVTFTQEEKEWVEKNRKPYVFQYDSPKRVDSYIETWLGNSGDKFEENYEHLYLMEEFVEGGYVKVFDVSEDFYNTFNKAGLNSLSLCNIFEIENN